MADRRRSLAVRCLSSAASALLLVGGCATTVPSPGTTAQGDDAGVTSARLVRANAAEAASWSGVRYDRARGVCSEAAVQLVDAASFDRIVADARRSADCSGVELSAVPETTAYPKALIDAGIAGSAHVLTIVDESGTATEAFAVCVSDRRFAAVAEAAVLGLQYRPAVCDGEPAPSAVLVPLAYDPD